MIEGANSFEYLREAVESGRLQIGVHKADANTMGSMQSNAWRGLNTLVGCVGPLAVIACFIWLGWQIGGVALMALFATVWLVQVAAAARLRKMALSDPWLFDQLYTMRALTIRINATGRIFKSPEDWHIALDHAKP